MDKETLQKAITKYGTTLRLVVAMEEMAELQQAIAKKIRNPESSIENLKEEIADVYIMLAQLMTMFDIGYDDMIKDVDKKIERLNTRINNEND